ncbi:hypothetical protein GMRT_10268 [Giardia muris]|uniref:Uncharacterized protein n=1 Tax=Giardia muris TaxID=5742 RepID=A0A4Z1SUS1_GIAMU|nr:hypothetical protein GMRT_10268 [Giardia muris]|eukprot:TNJ29440.1 hypothetical protein GMRT_10268 [Giardia muris]
MSRMASFLHVFPPQPRHIQMGSADGRSIDLGVEICEYVTHLSEGSTTTFPVIALSTDQSDKHIFADLIVEPGVYHAMHDDYCEPQTNSPPLEVINKLASMIAARASSGASQLILSFGPVGSGHGTLSFGTIDSGKPVQIERIPLPKHLKKLEVGQTSAYATSVDLSLLTPWEQKRHLTLQQAQHERAVREELEFRKEVRRVPRGLLWATIQAVGPDLAKESVEWPKMACFTIEPGSRIADLLDYPVGEEYGLSDMQVIEEATYTDVLNCPADFQMYFEKVHARAQDFDMALYPDPSMAATAFMRSNIYNPAAKDLSMSYRSAMRQAAGESSCHGEPSQLSESRSIVTVHESEAGPFAAPGPYDYLNKKIRQGIPTIREIRTRGGVITHRDLARAGVRFMSVNPSTLHLLHLSLHGSRRPLCTWDSIKLVQDRGRLASRTQPSSPTLSTIRKRVGLNDYTLALDACGPTVTILYLGPARGNSCIIFVDCCTCTMHTPLEGFTAAPQMQTSLQALSALKTLISSLHKGEKTLLAAKAHFLTRILVGHMPDLIKEGGEPQRIGTEVRRSSQNDISRSDTASSIEASDDRPSILIFHSIQGASIDAKSTAQQLRLAAFLDQQVELGYYLLKKERINTYRRKCLSDILQGERGDHFTTPQRFGSTEMLTTLVEGSQQRGSNVRLALGLIRKDIDSLLYTEPGVHGGGRLENHGHDLFEPRAHSLESGSESDDDAISAHKQVTRNASNKLDLQSSILSITSQDEESSLYTICSANYDPELSKSHEPSSTLRLSREYYLEQLEVCIERAEALLRRLE